MSVFSNGTVDLRRPRVVRHKSPDALFAAMERIGGKPAPVAEVRKYRDYMRRAQCWGFLELRGPVLHFWVGPKVKFTELLDLFAHEIAHAIHEAPKSALVRVAKEPLQEQRAEVYAAVAGLALELANRYFPWGR